MMVGKGWAVGEQQEGKPSHSGDYYSWYYPDHKGSHRAGIPPPARPLPGGRPPSVPVLAAVRPGFGRSVCPASGSAHSRVPAPGEPRPLPGTGPAPVCAGIMALYFHEVGSTGCAGRRRQPRRDEGTHLPHTRQQRQQHPGLTLCSAQRVSSAGQRPGRSPDFLCNGSRKPSCTQVRRRGSKEPPRVFRAQDGFLPLRNRLRIARAR